MKEFKHEDFNLKKFNGMKKRIYLKILALSIMMIWGYTTTLFSQNDGSGTFAKSNSLFQDFENSAWAGTGAGSYSIRTVTDDLGSWSVSGVTNPMDASDRYNGARSIRLRGNSGDNCNVTMLFDKPDGIGNLTFKYGAYAAHNGGQISAFYSIDQGSNWDLIESVMAPTWVAGGSEMLTANFEVNVPGNIRVRIVRDGTLANSTTVNIDDIDITDYIVSQTQVSTPIFTPVAGTYTSAQNVEITCATEDATIYYTTNGIDPTTASSVYTSAIPVNATTTIKAFAVKEGMDNSEIAEAVYTFIPVVDGNFSKISSLSELTDGYYVIAFGSTQAMNNTNGGTFFGNTAINPVSEVITDPFATIVWKIETNGSNKTIYNEMSSLYVSYNGSANAAYSTNPTPLTNAEMWSFDYVNDLFRIQSVNVPGRYLQFNNNSGQYRFACYTGTQQYLTLYKMVTASDAVATPSFSPVTGTYTSAQIVEITCATEGATIYYTTNGTDPTTVSTEYTAAIPINTTTTIKAFAIKDGMDNSEIAEAVYTINYEPSLSINPTFFNFGFKDINGSYQKEFIVSTDNLTSDLAVSVTGDGFSVDITTIAQTAVETVLTVTFNPTAVQSYSGVLHITGNGITDPELALSGNGIPLYTNHETFNTLTDLAGNAAYNSGTQLGISNIEWSWVSCQDGNKQSTPYTIEGVTPVIRYADAYIEATIQGGISAFSLDYKRAYTSAASRIVEVYINDNLVGSGVNCGGDSDLRFLFVDDLTIANDFTVRITLNGTGTTNAQTCIDNFKWDPYISNQVVTPTFSPVGGTYTSAQNVEITCATEGATIYYTTNGTDPTTASSVYTSAIPVNATTTLKAFAVKEGMDDSEIATATYTINYEPSMSIEPTSYNFGSQAIDGIYTKEFIVTTANLTSNLAVSAIGGAFYVDVSTIAQTATETIITVTFNPTEVQSYNGVLHITGTGITDPEVALSGSGVISGINLPFQSDFSMIGGFSDNSGSSMPILTESNFPQGFLFAGSQRIYAGGQKLKFGASNEIGILSTDVINTGGVSIIDVKFDAIAWPNTTAARQAKVILTYGENSVEIMVEGKSSWPVTFDDLLEYTCQFPAISTPTSLFIKTDTENSSTQEYRIFLNNVRIYEGIPPTQVATPTFSPVAGTYTSAQNVEINCATEGTTIYYTTNGADPTTASTVYTSAIPVNVTTTIKAFAVKDGLDNSEIAEAIYTINYEPSISINPTSYDFGNKGLNGFYTKEFIVTTANLTSDLTVSVTGDGFSVDITTIAQTATETVLTVTFNPTEVQSYSGVLHISGTGITDPEVALSGAGVIKAWEDFEEMIGSGSYNGSSVTLATGPWYIKGYTTMDGNDRRNGARSVRLRGAVGDEGHRVEMEFDKSDGAGIISFKYGSYSNHSGGKIQLFVSSDSGETWDAVGDEITVPSWINGGEVLLSADIEVYRIGNIRIKIEKVNALANSSLNIDDIDITDCFETDPVIIASPMQIDFEEVKISNSSEPVTINVTGYNLTDIISYSMSGLDAPAFNVTETNWNPATGGTVSVVFTPTEKKEYYITLSFSSPDAPSACVAMMGTGVDLLLPKADFIADKTTIIVGESVNFTDLSTGYPTEYNWTFTGGTPQTSSEQNPTVFYNEVGVYDVTLTVTNEDGSDSEIKTGYITVNEPGPFFEDFEVMTGSGSYNGASVTFATGNWYIKGYTTMDNNDRRNGARSIRLRGNATDEGHRAEMEFDKPDGASVISFKYGSYSSHSGGVIQLFVSTDEGDSWEAVGEAITAPSWIDGGEILQTAEIDVYIMGNIRIKIEKVNAAANTSVNIDDIEILDFTIPEPFLKIISPVNNAIIEDNEVEVEFIVGNFDLGTDGKVKYTFSNGSPEYTLESPILLEDLDEGLHTIILELVDMDNNSLENEVIVTLNFTIKESGINTFVWGDNLVVYPNPFVDIINFNNFENVERVTVTNILGQKVIEIKPTESKINVNNLNKGIYIITFTNKEGKMVVRKMVKN